MSNYEFEQKTRAKAEVVAKHIKAMLKVGKANAMSVDDIRIQLEHFCPTFKKIEEYVLKDALALLYETDVKGFHSIGERLFYLREVGEAQDAGWY